MFVSPGLETNSGVTSRVESDRPRLIAGSGQGGLASEICTQQKAASGSGRLGRTRPQRTRCASGFAIRSAERARRQKEVTHFALTLRECAGGRL